PGTWAWTTASAKVVLTDATTHTVKMTGGAAASVDAVGEEVGVVFTSAAGTALPAVKAKIVVVKLEVKAADGAADADKALPFSKSATQKNGYDDMAAAAGVEHHVSVKRNDTTTVKVKIEGGADSSVLVFKSADATIADATAPGAAAAEFDLTVNGKAQDKAET